MGSLGFCSRWQFSCSQGFALVDYLGIYSLLTVSYFDDGARDASCHEAFAFQHLTFKMCFELVLIVSAAVALGQFAAPISSFLLEVGVETFHVYKNHS